MFSALVLAAAVLVIITAVVFVLKLVKRYRQNAMRHGYVSLRAYLRAAPASEQETKEAVDLAMYGLAFCIVGLAFPPFLFIGVFPAFFGGRKLIYSILGLGLSGDLGSSDL